MPLPALSHNSSLIGMVLPLFTAFVGSYGRQTCNGAIASPIAGRPADRKREIFGSNPTTRCVLEHRDQRRVGPGCTGMHTDKTLLVLSVLIRVYPWPNNVFSF